VHRKLAAECERLELQPVFPATFITLFCIFALIMIMVLLIASVSGGN